MKEMLYIDGQLVDLGEGVDITLNYKSNLLTDLGKIVGNNSYTIRLPKTMRNLSIIGLSDIPSVVSSFPRVNHEARYFRNGVEIISDGKAVLMGVGDAIEVVITWSGAAAFSALVNEGKKLTDFVESTVWMAWTSVASVGAYGVANVMYSDIYFGLKASETQVVMHPSVRVTYVLSMIEAVYGLKFNFPDDRKDFVNSLIIPLLTRKGGYANRESNTGRIYKDASGNLSLSKGAAFTSYFEDNGVTMHKVLKGGTLVATPSFRSSNGGLAIKYGTESIEENTVYLPYEIDNSVTLYPYIYNTPVEIDMVEGDTFMLEIGLGLTNQAEGANGMVYSFGIQPTEIQLGDRFPIVENLPDIKLIDFIKAIASMCGVFAIPTSGGSIDFVPFATLTNYTNALDWSDRLIPLSLANTPRNIVYRLDDFARNNRMTYKKDDTVSTIADGNIIVGDDTLDYERDAVALPFAPSDMQGRRATIKLYEYNDDNEAELQDLEPRILVETNVGGLSTGSFRGLSWGTLLRNYYTTYQNAVKSPVVITEHILLDELSLRDLDVSKPVYLRQYGKYYAIVEVKAPSSGVCECKLLQLED